MSIPEIRIAVEEDRTTIIQTVVLGFVSDPLARWMLPDAATYLRVMPQSTEAFGGGAIGAGAAYLADEGKAAALWMPPGTNSDGEALEKLIGENTAPEILEYVVAVFAEMDTYHPHDEPCWYLPMIAADPAWLGQGLGGMLMKHALRRIDEDGLPAYLESSNLRNISLYERHGFEIMGQIQHGSSPVVTPMLRPARG
jgi:ribosomal protein S18 acetylase RimI-like enzyme